MNAKIELNGDWVDCSLLHPHQEPALLIPGPLGTQQWQQSSYSRFNAKLSLPVTSQPIPLGKYKIRFKGTERMFESLKPELNIIWGNVLYAQAGLRKVT